MKNIYEPATENREPRPKLPDEYLELEQEDLIKRRERSEHGNQSKQYR
jgi:hypothetical protein